jgi:ATPase subunit of ABC transporter with duplicated ATPase domains
VAIIGNITMTQPYILINQMSYNLPSEQPLFNGLNLTLTKHKIGLVGKNGIGKSTLFKLITGTFYPRSGSIQLLGKLSLVPQQPAFAENKTVADVMNCADKIQALHRIREGSIDEKDFMILNEEWDIEERLKTLLITFGLQHIPLERQIKALSGGEITRLLLTKAFFSDADYLLLDEPSNHLDSDARKKLYTAIQQWQGGLCVISHDRALLNLMDEIIELSSLGVISYGGNYDFYEEQKNIERSAKQHQLEDAKKFIQKTKTSVQSSREKHEQKQSYGKELKRSGSIDKLGANSKKGRSERTQRKLLVKEKRMMQQADTELQTAKEKVEILEKIKVDIPSTKVPTGKVILDIEEISFSYDRNLINHFSIKLVGPARVALVGNNGSGKTTLIKLLLKQLPPQSGKIFIGTEYVSYLDQNASSLNSEMSIVDNFLQMNPDASVNDAYRSLAKFLFKNTLANKLVKELSGGEKLRALLACVLMSKNPPQLLILDEPTNHLDLDSVKTIESALENYQGAMIVVSHDKQFLKNINIEKNIYAPFNQL